MQFKFTLVVSANSGVSDLTGVHYVKAESLVTFEIIPLIVIRTKCLVANKMKSIKMETDLQDEASLERMRFPCLLVNLDFD